VYSEVERRHRYGLLTSAAVSNVAVARLSTFIWSSQFSWLGSLCSLKSLLRLREGGRPRSGLTRDQ
jgi:hypothetical protein